MPAFALYALSAGWRMECTPISGTKSSSFHSSDWNEMLMLRFIGLCYLIARALIVHETNLESYSLKIPLNIGKL